MKTISEALTNIGGGGGGGSDDGGSTSGGNSFVVTMTYDANDYSIMTADKTNAEIMDAFLAGDDVYAVFSMTNESVTSKNKYALYSAYRLPGTNEVNLSFITFGANRTSSSGGTMMMQVLSAASTGATNTDYDSYNATWQFTIPSQP